MNGRVCRTRWLLTAALVVWSAAASAADPSLPNADRPVPEPHYQVVPISDGGQHSVDSSWSSSLLIGPGDGAVAGINNKNKIVFRAGGVYQWNGHSLILERRVTLGSDTKGASGLGKTAASPSLAAWAINDAGDVLVTGPGGLYLVHPGGSTGPPPDLIIPNLHPEHLDGQTHGAIQGGINNNEQIVGDIEVADGETADASAQVSSGHATIFWQAGHLYNIQDAPVMTGKLKPGQTNGIQSAETAKTTGGAENIRLYDWSEGASVDQMIFIPCGLNDVEHVVGVFLRAKSKLELPVLWDGSHWRILLTPSGVTGLVPEGINNADDVVGAAMLGDGNDQTISGNSSPASPDAQPKTEATLIHRRTAFDLNDCIPTDSGWHLTDAVGINDHGEIVGWGTLKGKPMSFLLLPLASGMDTP